MIAIIITLGTMGLLTSIPLVAIMTAHKRSSMKLQLKMMEQEAELEKLKMESYAIETEKLRLELAQEKQALLEMEQSNRLSHNDSK
ncbi:hypothetical protein MHH70_05415 [Metasolibacillus sp. FSL H7-0170]|uniref:hypothetical protein n=1 Tax=Metasolibacillus TaxID=2703677 RepID=UPI00079396F7|nr:hypothetical protein [Metasolibacillus fluoroglycofenilyticus]KYG88936.1 hypothetical protein A0U40_14650 [[Bacillus] sp. KCTC 13219]